MKQRKENISDFRINFWLGLFFGFLLFAGLLSASFVSSMVDNILGKKLADIEEAKKPANIEIVIIKDDSCEKCFDIAPYLDLVKKANTSVISEKIIDFKSEDGKKIVEENKIEKLPSFIAKGEIEKNSSLKSLWQEIGKISEGRFVFTKVGNPYIEASSGKIKGDVEFIILQDKNCSDCFSLDDYINAFQKYGLPIGNKKVLDISSEEGAKAVKDYNIQKSPSLIIKGDVSHYSDILGKLGEINNDIFVLKTDGMFPYLDLKTGKIAGRTAITLISASDCAECANPENYLNFLSRIGMPTKDKNAVDYKSKEGEGLIDKYKIIAVPTVIITGDLNSYPDLGKIQKLENGAFILRKTSPPYLELDSKKTRGLIKIILISDKSCAECFSTDALGNGLSSIGLATKDKANLDVGSEEGKKLIDQYKIELVPTAIITGDTGAYVSLKDIWKGIGTIENDGAYIIRDAIKTIGTYKNLSTNSVNKKGE